MLLVGGLSLQQRQQLAAPGSAVAVPSGRSSRASTSSTTFGKNSSNGGVQSASAELDSDLLEFDENFASENHGRNSKNSAFQPRSESSLTYRVLLCGCNPCWFTRSANYLHNRLQQVCY